METAPNYNWSDGQKAAAKDFFTNAKSSDEIYGRAKELGLDSNQLADLWSQSTGGDYNAGVTMTSDYLKANNKAFSGGYVAPAANAIGGAPKNNGTRGTVVPNNDLSVANKPYTPKFDYSKPQLDAAREWFNAPGRTGDQIYTRAQELGLSAEQLADVYTRTVGGDYNSNLGIVNTYISQSGKTPLVAATSNKAVDGYTGSNGIYGYNNVTDVAKSNAVNWSVTPDQTMEGRMQGLLSQNNPLVQIAQTQGLESANQRGLLNSSLGAEAGALAHYQYAADIAKTDANTFASAARQNASENTNINLQNSNALNARSTLDTTIADRIATTKTAAETELARMDAANKNAIDLLGPQYANQIRNNYTATMATAYGEYQKTIERIQASEMLPADKTAQLAEQDASYKTLVGYMNALYENMPNWSKEWSVIPKA